MSGKLSGKVAIVTGGAGGFGKGIAEKFKQEGAEVIIADFVDEAGERMDVRLFEHRHPQRRPAPRFSDLGLTLRFFADAWYIPASFGE